MAKRPCGSLPELHTLTPHSGRIPEPPRNNPMAALDSLLGAFLEAFDAPSSLDLAVDRLVESKESDVDREALIDRATRVGAALLEAGKLAARNRAAALNSAVWPLPSDLTIKVFGNLDTQSVCNASATCTMFYKCAMDPLCYVNINLLIDNPTVSNTIVSKMVQNAGKNLESLKLGLITNPHKLGAYTHPLMRSTDTKGTSILTRSCLTTLSGNNGATGALLKQMYLHNIERLDDVAVCTALSVCPSLIDIEIVGLHVELKQVLVSISSTCHLIQRLYFDSSIAGRDDNLTASVCVDFVSNCPFVTSLSLRGCKLHDSKLKILIKGFHALRHLDISTSYSVTGTFIRNLGNTASENVLEDLIFRDCMHLKKVEVTHFLDAILTGEFKHLRHLDISNREGLAPDRAWDQRIFNPSFPQIKHLEELRPDICLLAEFPVEHCFNEYDVSSEMEFNPDISWPTDICLASTLSTPTSEGGSLFVSHSTGSYKTDSSNGNDDGNNNSDMVPEESSEDVEFVAG